MERMSEGHLNYNSIQQYIEYQASLLNNKLDDVPNCSFPLGATAEEDIAKIESYTFGDIHKYMKGEYFHQYQHKGFYSLCTLFVFKG